MKVAEEKRALLNKGLEVGIMRMPVTRETSKNIFGKEGMLWKKGILFFVLFCFVIPFIIIIILAEFHHPPWVHGKEGKMYEICLPSYPSHVMCNYDLLLFCN